jgi:GNAT superfamily N-acetyltransferase
MDYKIYRETEAVDKTIASIRSNLGNWNVSQSTIDDGENIVLTIKKDDGTLIAGIVAWLWGAGIELEYLWVDINEQGKGLGSQLLRELERIATDKGCHNIFTNTYSFQAPEFYSKFGYESMGVVSGFPDRVTKHFFKKKLR